MRDRQQPDVHPCLSCGNPYLEGYPHRHHSDPRPGYDPMGPKPADRDTLIALVRSEYRAELPERLHVAAVPSQLEEIWQEQRLRREDPHKGATDAGAGYLKVTDSGALGAPSFSPAFHRYIGATRWWEGEMVMADGDLRPFPWTRNLEGIRRWCSGKHRSWYEHRGEPLCWLLLRLVVLGGYSTGRAAQALAADGFAVSPEKADELFDVAVGKWWTWTANDLNGLTLRRVRRPAA